MRQGDIYWFELDAPVGSEPGYRRPAIVIQSDEWNESGLKSTIVCLLTANTQRAKALGHVLIPSGEANLPRDSVANPTQLWTVDQSELDEYIGTLSAPRLKQVLDGVAGVLGIKLARPQR